MITVINNHVVKCSVEEFIALTGTEGVVREKAAPTPEEKPTSEAKPKSDKAKRVHIGEGNQRLPVKIKVEKVGEEPIVYDSIRKAELAIYGKRVNLPRYFRDGSESVTTGDITFTKVNGGEKEGKPKEVKVKVKAKAKKAMRGRKLNYYVFYSNGDHKLISLKGFCEEHGLSYPQIYYRTKDGKPYETDGYKFQRRPFTNIRKGGKE